MGIDLEIQFLKLINMSNIKKNSNINKIIIKYLTKYIIYIYIL